MNSKENKSFKVIIAGSRDFNNELLLYQTCDILLENKRKDSSIVIISGTARGADQLGEKYALSRGFQLIKKPADWDRYGKKAGYLRNIEMAKMADALIAFWDGNSRGTKMMIEEANRRNLQVRVINYNDGITEK